MSEQAIPWIQRDESAPKIVRVNTCPDGHKYVGDVTYSEHTQALSGERHVHCPACGNMPFSKSVWMLQIGGRLYDVTIGRDVEVRPIIFEHAATLIKS